jgi:hypothetical protein
MRNYAHVNKENLTILHANIHALTSFRAEKRRISRQHMEIGTMSLTCVYVLRLQRERFALVH